jgi:hypothetical protein
MEPTAGMSAYGTRKEPLLRDIIIEHWDVAQLHECTARTIICVTSPQVATVTVDVR